MGRDCCQLGLLVASSVMRLVRCSLVLSSELPYFVSDWETCLIGGWPVFLKFGWHEALVPPVAVAKAG